MPKPKAALILRSPILWGVLATVAVLAGFWAVVSFLGKPLAEHSLELNEVGDFFSGLAAPLAFIWLVVAVFLQRHELQAQREQLEQQREELRLSREQLMAQAEELRAQSKSLSHQEQMLEGSQRLSDWQARVSQFLRELTDKIATAEYHLTGNTWWGLFGGSGRPDPLIKSDQFEELSQHLALRIKSYLIYPPENLRNIPDCSPEIKELEQLVDESQFAPILYPARPYKLEELLAQVRGLQDKFSAMRAG